MVITNFIVNFIIRLESFFLMSLESALQSLKRGEFVLLFDSAGRENEIDMVVAAEFVTPEHVARMRQYMLEDYYVLQLIIILQHPLNYNICMKFFLILQFQIKR